MRSAPDRACRILRQACDGDRPKTCRLRMEDGHVAIQEFELPAAQLRVVCDPDSLGFETTAQLGQLEKAVGQERALAAIDLGLDIRTQGYNIFAVGPTGTGRMTAVLSRAKEAAARQPTPPDWCYVYNFDEAPQAGGATAPARVGERFRQRDR